MHVVIGIATAYAIGTEFSRRSRGAWLRCAGDSPLIALTGKLLPLFALFFALLGIEALILHAGFELAYRGNVLMMVVAAMLFIVAYQSLAALLTLLCAILPWVCVSLRSSRRRPWAMPPSVCRFRPRIASQKPGAHHWRCAGISCCCLAGARPTFSR